MSKQNKTPKWLLSLYYYYHAATQGEWRSNEQMARLFGGGYYARNHLACNGEITKRGIEHEYRDVNKDGSRFRLYKLKTESLSEAAKVLTAYGMIKR
jgi:hypothetical protein